VNRPTVSFVLALGAMVAGCSSRWFSQASDDNTSYPLLVIEPEPASQPVTFDVEIHGTPDQGWCLGVRLTNGTFFDGRSTRSSRCQMVTTDSVGDYDYELSVASPLAGMGALLAEISPSCTSSDGGASDPANICGGPEPTVTTVWPLVVPVIVVDAGVDAAPPVDAHPRDASVGQ
jgi:hypothetical protein